MLTVKHVEKSGYESVFEAETVQFTPTMPSAPRGVSIFGSPGLDEGARTGNHIQFSDGIVYVMNEGGKTIAVYNLS